MAPWKLPLVVVAIVAAAVRQRPQGEIGEPPAAAGRRRVLVVVSRPVEEPWAIEEIAGLVRQADAAAAAGVEVLLLAPARIGFLDRWASDIEAARREAQQRLVLTVASLAKAGVGAEARVGDEDLVQAVEDQLRSFAATDLILVTGSAEEDPAGEAAAVELRRRLRAEFRRLKLSGRAAH